MGHTFFQILEIAIASTELASLFENSPIFFVKISPILRPLLSLWANLFLNQQYHDEMKLSTNSRLDELDKGFTVSNTIHVCYLISSSLVLLFSGGVP